MTTFSPSLGKRLFDCIVSLIGLVLLVPLFLVLAIMIKVFDPGPVFFRQARVGKKGRSFYIYKFRSMRVFPGAEEGCFEAGCLSRVTPVGRLLRKSKVDELPQLYNVLKGDMSLVGPRPEVRKWVAVYPDRWEKVLSVQPGITDCASVDYRNEEELLASSGDPEHLYRDEILPRKLSLYEAYVDHHSFLGDVKLILETIRVCLF